MTRAPAHAAHAATTATTAPWMTRATEVRLTVPHITIAIVASCFAILLAILVATLWTASSTVSRTDFEEFKADVKSQLMTLSAAIGDGKTQSATMAERQAQATKSTEAVSAKIDALSAKVDALSAKVDAKAAR